MNSIVNVKTPDGLTLHGVLTEPSQPSKTIVLHIHGSGRNFFGNVYFEHLTNSVVHWGIAYLATNNRGEGVYATKETRRFGNCATGRVGRPSLPQ